MPAPRSRPAGPAGPGPPAQRRHLHPAHRRVRADPAHRRAHQLPRTPTVAGHVRNFADLMNKHRGDRLPDWMRQVQADNLPALHSPVTDLRRDLAAVTAGLTMTWNSGPVEGTVNRIKTIKS